MPGTENKRAGNYLVLGSSAVETTESNERRNNVYSYIDFLFLMCSKNKRSWATHIHSAMKFRVEQTEILRSITLD